MKHLSRALTLLLMVGTLMVVTTAAASAHTIGLSGETSCQQDGSWKVLVTVKVTNTPSTGTDSQSEVKATKPTGSPGVSKEGGTGVMSGGQVILNAWIEHANNWPGVQARKGNYTEHYTVTVPANVNSVETEVQIDWKGWGSDDPKKTFHKPENCVTHTSGVEKKTRTFTPEVTCESHIIVTYQQESTRSWTQEGGSPKVYTEWSEWANVGDETAVLNPTYPCVTEDQEQRFRHFVIPGTCATNPQTGVVYQESHRTITVDHGVRTVGEWSAWKTYRTVYPNSKVKDCDRKAHVRTKVTDLCSCRLDHVKMFYNHNKVRVHSERVNRTTWKFTVAGKYDKKTGLQYLVPSKIGGSHGWSLGTIYTVHTTAKPCPCRLRGDCQKVHPNFNPPHNCVGRLNSGTCK